MSVTILDHALIQHKLTIMRDKNTSTYIFKQNLDEIAKLMAFEVTRNVSLKDKAIETPVCPMVGKEMDQQIILAPILRAGIGLVDGFRDIIPTAKVGHIGMERDEETLIPREYYAKFPKGLEDALVIVLDPMLATGGSANMAIENIKQRGARKIKLVCLVGAPEGVKAIQEVHPDVDITLAALDEKLNEHGYIVCLEQMNNKEKLFKDLLYALTLSGKIFGTLIAGVILGLYLDSILLTKPLLTLVFLVLAFIEVMRTLLKGGKS